MQAALAVTSIATDRDPALSRVPTRQHRRGAKLLLFALLCLLAMDASAADRKTRNALIGVGLGAAGGALLSHGDPWATVGGAAAGGLIGAAVTKDHRRHDRYDRGYRDNDRRDRDYRRDDRRDRGGWGR